MSDDIVRVLRLLEYAVPIGVCTPILREDTLLACTTMEGMHSNDTLADLHAIGSNILDSSSTHFSWDKSEILNPTKPLLGC